MQSTALVAAEQRARCARADAAYPRRSTELRDVMRVWVDPVNNLAERRRRRHIAYQTVGMIPLRSAANAWGPVPGWTGEHEWDASLSYDELPSCTTRSGVRSSPRTSASSSDAYPHHLSDGYSRPDRAERIWARLDALEARNRRRHGRHPPRRRLAARSDVGRSAPGALARRPASSSPPLALLRDWDGTMQVDSGAAAVVMVVRDAVCRRLVHGPGLGGAARALRR